jgi:ribosomal-protein-alanine N-acetyltransferase
MAVRTSDIEVCSEELLFSPMKRKHLRSVVAIEQQVYPEPWTTGLFVSELAMKAVRDYTVALIDDAVVGYAGLSYIEDEAHLTNIAIDPLFQGRSLATKLMLRCFELCTSRGVPNMTLEVRVSNLAAQALYRKFGFAPAGVRKNYYSSPREDALIMWVHDIDSADYQQRLTQIAAVVGDGNQ